MPRRLRIWLLFVLCLVLGTGAMLGLSTLLIRSDRAQARAQQQATLEAQARQCLWRMDYTFSLFLAPENSRPYAHFAPFYPGDRVFTRAHEEVDRSELRMPSPLLMMEDPLVWLRVELDARGNLQGPRIPKPEDRALARRLCPDPDRLLHAEQRLGEARSRLRWDRLHTAMTSMGKPPLTVQSLRDLRQMTPLRVLHGSWVPTWLDGQLCLLRQVWIDEQERLQVILMDWKEVREALVSTLRTTFPQAELAPVAGDAFPNTGFVMSSLPVRLDPRAPDLPAHRRSGLTIALSAAWGGFLLTGMMAGWVLHRTLQLSERRGAFVSAVTHELRTPLTTFRLYIDLLVRDMVPAEERPTFLNTLQAEADRLDHLIRNVLSFARLEARRNPHREDVTLGPMLERIRPRLEQRAALAGLPLIWIVPEPLLSCRLHTDPAAVEQILFNLVDNGCKYGGGSLTMSVSCSQGWLCLSIADLGPGIPPADRKRIFRSFHKSAQQAAQSQPGVGLGLALCRNLSHALSGKLELGETDQGAVFNLLLQINEKI